MKYPGYNSFAQVVVKWGAWDMEKVGQFLPKLQHVVDGISKTRIGFDLGNGMMTQAQSSGNLSISSANFPRA